MIRPPRPDEEAGNTEKDSGDPGPRDPSPKSIVVDLDQLLVTGDLTLNLTLYNGDVINVPVSGKVFVGGEVKAPGGFPLGGKKLTVSQAIALAGGLKYESAGRETKIFRYSGKGNEKEILSVDAYAIQEGKAEDFHLKENDIIIVPRSGTKATLSEIWDFIKGRIGGISLGTL